MVYFRHLEFKMADEARLRFLRTFGFLFSMGLRCYEPIFSLLLIFSTFILLGARTKVLRLLNYDRHDSIEICVVLCRQLNIACLNSVI